MARRLATFLVASVAVVASAAACSRSPAPETEADDLVGGTLAAPGEFPSTLVVRQGCTVAKVGPRHLLTAAHCVYNGPARDVRAAYAPGAAIELGLGVQMDNAIDAAAAGYRRVTVERTYVHGAYFEERGIDGWPRVLLDSAPPDLAVIVLDEASRAALAEVPEAEIDLSPLPEGAPVVIGGYGCEAGLEGAKATTARLRRQRTRTVGAEALLHEGSSVKDLASPHATHLVRQYLFTPGRGGVAPAAPDAGADDPAADLASICPGDSGGPVYLDDGAARRIVGVNAYYSFHGKSVDPARISRTNWHVRLDVGSRFDTGTWLATLGVRTAHAEPTTHFDGCVTSPTTRRSLCGALRAHVDAAGGEAAFGAPTFEARWERGADARRDAGAVEPGDAAAPGAEGTGEAPWRWSQRFGDRTLEVVAGPGGAEAVRERAAP